MPRSSLRLAVGFVAAVSSAIPAAIAQPYGSYLETWRRVQQRGPVLYAYCLNRESRWAETSLDLRSCLSREVANRNGRLICPGGRGLRSY